MPFHRHLFRFFRLPLPTLFLLSLLYCIPAHSQIAIIDSAFDTRPYLNKLENAGVLVVGRYYARCTQWWDKRLIDTVAGTPDSRPFSKSEIDMLKDMDFAILSIYQYYNNSAEKFDGKRRRGNRVVPLPGEDCAVPTTAGRSPEEEGRLDAEAAVSQAGKVGQPPGSAIYFGVDFDLPANTRQRNSVVAKMKRYFTEVKKIVNRAGYKMGSYGSGFANDVLKQSGLVDYTWMSPSAAHRGSIAYYRSNAWNLFQNTVEWHWFAGTSANCADRRWRASGGSGMLLDTNVQNPQGPADIGFWRKNGVYTVPSSRTKKVFNTLRFVCDGTARIRNRQGRNAEISICRRRARDPIDVLTHGWAVIIGDSDGDLIQFDVNNDGKFDGWTKALNLSGDFKDRPEWYRNNSSVNCP